jgi:hypothetical protein
MPSQLAGLAMEAVGGGALGGVAGLLFGLLAGLLFGLFHFDFTWLPVYAAGAALAGAAAGALCLAGGRSIDGVGLVDDLLEISAEPTAAEKRSRLCLPPTQASSRGKGVHHRLDTYFAIHPRGH